MNPGPYLNGYLPVSRASDALRNQADTMLSELHGSIDRAKAFREKLAQRKVEAEVETIATMSPEATRVWSTITDHHMRYAERDVAKIPRTARQAIAAALGVTFPAGVGE